MSTWTQSQGFTQAALEEFSTEAADYVLIAYTIETDKQLLAEHQDAIAAIEKALTNKTELTGIEVHQILDPRSHDDLRPYPSACAGVVS